MFEWEELHEQRPRGRSVAVRVTGVWGEAAEGALGLLVNARPQHQPGAGRSFSLWPCLFCEP